MGQLVGQRPGGTSRRCAGAADRAAGGRVAGRVGVPGRHLPPRRAARLARRGRRLAGLGRRPRTAPETVTGGRWESVDGARGRWCSSGARTLGADELVQGLERPTSAQLRRRRQRVAVAGWAGELEWQVGRRAAHRPHQPGGVRGDQHRAEHVQQHQRDRQVGEVLHEADERPGRAGRRAGRARPGGSGRGSRSRAGASSRPTVSPTSRKTRSACSWLTVSGSKPSGRRRSCRRLCGPPPVTTVPRTRTAAVTPAMPRTSSSSGRAEQRLPDARLHATAARRSSPPRRAPSRPGSARRPSTG